MLSATLDEQPTAPGDLSAGALLDEMNFRYGAKVQINIALEVAQLAGIRDTPA